MSYFKEAEIVEIPIRQDLTIRIHGIPYDLTADEARKVANIVLAYADVASKATNVTGADNGTD